MQGSPQNLLACGGREHERVGEEVGEGGPRHRQRAALAVRAPQDGGGGEEDGEEAGGFSGRGRAGGGGGHVEGSSDGGGVTVRTRSHPPLLPLSCMHFFGFVSSPRRVHG